MATSVLLFVTPKEPIDRSRFVGQLPADVAAALRARGQPVGAGMSRRGNGPWRLRFQLSGEDRVRAGQTLLVDLREKGYEADLVIGHVPWDIAYK